MEKYEELEMEVTTFDAEDVITESEVCTEVGDDGKVIIN